MKEVENILINLNEKNINFIIGIGKRYHLLSKNGESLYYVKKGGDKELYSDSRGGFYKQKGSDLTLLTQGPLSDTIIKYKNFKYSIKRINTFI